MDEEVREGLKRISAATISMQLLKRGIRNCYIAGATPLGSDAPNVVGEAYTLRYVPWREDRSTPDVLAATDYPPRRAIEDAPAGSVLVIDGRGRSDVAVMGDLLAARLAERGVAGVVTDGGIRDAADVVATGLAVYAAGPAAPASINGHSAADLQTPVACGGVAVFPGDVIKADTDGVIVIPAHLAQDIARDGPAQERFERFALEKIKEGRPVIGTYPPNEATRAEYETWSELDED